jgi:sugar phosphate isomerase/epimerase
MSTRKIALSLPYSYLAGEIESKRDSILLDLFGPVAGFLEELHGRVTGVELSHFTETAPPEQIETAVRAAKKAGLEVILHPSLPSRITGTDLTDLYPWIDKVIAEAAPSQSSLLLNMHTLSSSSGEEDLRSLIEKTIENLQQLLARADRAPFPISVAVEINREKGIIDPSTRYENLVEICRRVDHPALGIGWDLGHTCSNVLRGLIPKEPPREFIERVIHSHIHDLGRNGQTHWPLGMGTLPLDFYMENLRSVHYTGYHTLELYPERFINVLPARERILESIEILDRAIYSLHKEKSRRPGDR